MGVLNLWVAFNFDTDTWVNFKMFGGIGLMLAFVVGQALYLGRYLKEPEQNTATKDSSHE
jgi:intracellular septation protein